MTSNTTARAAEEHTRRYLGPVSAAVATMRAAHPDRLALHELRDAILSRVRCDLDRLDLLADAAGAVVEART